MTASKRTHFRCVARDLMGLTFGGASWARCVRTSGRLRRNPWATRMSPVRAFFQPRMGPLFVARPLLLPGPYQRLVDVPRFWRPLAIRAKTHGEHPRRLAHGSDTNVSNAIASRFFLTRSTIKSGPVRQGNGQAPSAPSRRQPLAGLRRPSLRLRWKMLWIQSPRLFGASRYQR